MSQNTPVVFVVDDNFYVRESVKSLISDAGWEPETFDTAHKFLSRPSVPVPSCLVLDLNLPDLNGLDLQRRLAAERADMPIIFITGCADISTTVQAMKAGAFEFLVKPLSGETLLGAIHQALDRSRIALHRAEKLRQHRDCYGLLSRREREVMTLVVRGIRNRQIGLELGISEITVKVHRGRVMQKMGARSLADLVTMAANLHLSSAQLTQHPTYALS